MKAQLHSGPLALMTERDFESLILPLKNRLYRVSHLLLRNREEAQDVVQEVMLRVWRDRQEVTGIQNWTAWCLRMCRNLALDHVKRKGRRYERVEEQPLVANTLDPAQWSEQQESLQRVEEALASLPATQREILHLRDVEGFSYQEIGDILELDQTKVKVYLHRARRAVRDKLQKLHAYGLS